MNGCFWIIGGAVFWLPIIIVYLMFRGKGKRLRICLWKTIVLWRVAVWRWTTWLLEDLYILGILNLATTSRWRDRCYERRRKLLESIEDR